VATLFKRRNPVSPDIPIGGLSSRKRWKCSPSEYGDWQVALSRQPDDADDERIVSQAEDADLFFEAPNGNHIALQRVLW
jgi:hypothetical protein